MRAFLPVLVVAAMGCPADEKVDSGTPEPEPIAYNLAVTVTEALPTDPAVGPAVVPEGLCATLVDPSPVISGDDAIDLADGTTDASGMVTFSDITAKPTLGLLIQIDDCDGAKVDYVGIATNTGVLPATYANAKDGETVATNAFAIKGVSLEGMAMSATTAGYKGDLNNGGFLFGYTFDSSLMPVEGVTVSTDVGSPTYLYLDGDPTDGLFTTNISKDPKKPDLQVNAQTTPAGVFVVADAEIGQYQATDTAGKLTFESNLIGGFPGQAVVIAFIGM